MGKTFEQDIWGRYEQFTSVQTEAETFGLNPKTEVVQESNNLL